MGMFKKKKVSNQFKKVEPQIIEDDIVEEDEIIEEEEEIVEEKPVKEKVIKEKIVKEETKLKERIQIVKDYPMAPVKQYVEEDGTVVHIFTIEDFLTQEANID